MEYEKIEMFRRSIIRSFRKEFKNMKDEDQHYIEEMADNVIKEFKGEDVVDDDDVDPRIRDVLYLLEAMGVLKMDITEKHIIDGRVWRNHYWVMNPGMIESPEVVSDNVTMECLSRNPFEDLTRLYHGLPDDIWEKRNFDDLSGSA